MQALNLGNAVALQAQQNNVGIARQQLETNFIIPAVIPPGEMGYLCTYASFIAFADIIQGQYVLLPTNITTIPSFANIAQPGALAFAVFKATHLAIYNQLPTSETRRILSNYRFRRPHSHHETDRKPPRRST